MIFFCEKLNGFLLLFFFSFELQVDKIYASGKITLFSFCIDLLTRYDCQRSATREGSLACSTKNKASKLHRSVGAGKSDSIIKVLSLMRQINATCSAESDSEVMTNILLCCSEISRKFSVMDYNSWVEP